MITVKKVVVGEIQTNCYLLVSEDKKEMIVVDPGGEAEKILEEIKKLNTKVKYIINTHYHFDHVLVNFEIKKATGAKLLIHENEKEYIEFEADRYLKEGDKIKIGQDELDVILTPGHSPGSICLIGDGFIVTGDTLFHDGIGRTDLAGGSDDEMEKSLKRLDEIIKPGMKVYPGH